MEVFFYTLEGVLCASVCVFVLFLKYVIICHVQTPQVQQSHTSAKETLICLNVCVWVCVCALACVCKCAEIGFIKGWGVQY